MIFTCQVYMRKGYHSSLEGIRLFCQKWYILNGKRLDPSRKKHY